MYTLFTLALDTLPDNYYTLLIIFNTITLAHVNVEHVSTCSMPVS